MSVLLSGDVISLVKCFVTDILSQIGSCCKVDKLKTGQKNKT